MSKVDKLYISAYNDIYGALLGGDAREYVRLYYDCDMTLHEIADIYSVTRQAVHETLTKTVKALESYESALGLYRLRKDLSELAAELRGGGEASAADRLDAIANGLVRVK